MGIELISVFHGNIIDVHILCGVSSPSIKEVSLPFTLLPWGGGGTTTNGARRFLRNAQVAKVCFILFLRYSGAVYTLVLDGRDSTSRS